MLLALAYLWAAGQYSRDEGVAAAIFAIAVTAFLVAAERTEPALGRIPWRGVVAVVCNTPWAIVRESYDILGPQLVRRLLGGRAVHGRWIALRYGDDAGDDPAMRRALVVLGSGITPNAIPLRIDAEHGRLELHQLVARREAGAERPRYPL